MTDYVETKIQDGLDALHELELSVTKMKQFLTTLRKRKATYIDKDLPALTSARESIAEEMDNFNTEIQEVEDAITLDQSVCDSCDETYSEALIRKDGTCPLCKKPHTLQKLSKLDKDFYI